MRAVLDTNIFVRVANREDPEHARTVGALHRFFKGGAELYVPPQVIFEFWSAATRPVGVNGLGFSVAMAKQHVQDIRSSFRVLHDPSDLLDRWLALCDQHAVGGRASHDARIVAWMQAHGLDRIVTLNPGDFARFPAIECVWPA